DDVLVVHELMTAGDRPRQHLGIGEVLGHPGRGSWRRRVRLPGREGGGVRVGGLAGVIADAYLHAACGGTSERPHDLLRGLVIGQPEVIDRDVYRGRCAAHEIRELGRDGTQLTRCAPTLDVAEEGHVYRLAHVTYLTPDRHTGQATTR